MSCNGYLPTNWPSRQIMTWEWLRKLYEILHEVHTIKIRFHHCNDKIIFASYWISAQKPKQCIKKFKFWENIWAKFQTKAQKNSKVHFQSRVKNQVLRIMKHLARITSRVQSYKRESKRFSIDQCSHQAAALRDSRKKNWNGALKPRRCAH